MKGEFEELVKALLMLSKIKFVEKLDIEIVYLPLGRKCSHLSDGFTRCRFLMAELEKESNRIFALIEVERDRKPLSMVVLK